MGSIPLPPHHAVEESFDPLDILVRLNFNWLPEKVFKERYEDAFTGSLVSDLFL